MTEEEKESAVGGTNDTSKVETSSVSNTEEGTKVEDDNVTENLASVVTETETASILIAATPIDNTKVLSSPQEQIPQIVASTPPDASPSTTHNDSKTKDDDNDVNDENNNNFTKTFTTVSKLVEGTEPTPFQLPVTIQENRGRKTKPLGCCEFPFGETVKCKWCIKNYHLKCLEPPLLYAPTSFVCERHLPDDIPPEPEPSDVPEAFSNYLLQSKVKLDWPLTKGETVSRKSLNTTKKEFIQEVDGTRAQCVSIRDSILPLPPNTGDPQNEGFDLKDIFLPEYLDEASNKDWSENAKLFRQFNDWVSMLRVLREARYLKSVINVEKRKASQTSSCYSSLSSSSSPAGAAGPAEKKKKFAPPLMKKMALLDAPRNPATLEAQMSLLSAEEEEDLDSPYMHATYSENVLAAVRIRKALIAGDFAGISAFPNLRAAIETAPAPEKAGAPCLTMYGRTVCVLDKEQTTIGRCKEGEKPPDVDLSALFGDLCRKVISHLHATIVCKNKEARKFVLCVNGRNGLFVDGLHRPHGDSITLRNGMQITIGLLPFVYVSLPLKK